MDLLSRAIKSRHFQLSHHLSRNTLFSPRPITAFHHFSLYCTANLQDDSNATDLEASSSKLKTQEPKKPRKPRTQKPKSEKPRAQKPRKSSSDGSEGIEKPGEALPTLPKLSEISYEPKVANSVSLFGYLQLPVRFHATPDGKNLSATVIAQQKCNISPFSHSKAMPVVFEGDLADSVARYVKENDCVFVTGKLSSVDRLPFVVSEHQGKFHLLGRDTNFVQAKSSGCTEKEFGEVADVVSRLESGETERVVKEYVGDSLHSDVMKIPKELERLKFDEKVGKGEDGDSICNPWADLVRNPKGWLDYREHKSNGFRKANYPDFKHKTSGFALWLDTAPEWVLPGIQGVEFAVSEVQFVKDSKEEEHLWKSLIENPERWWDNRLDKQHVHAPDFKQKYTGESLWLKNSPDWVLPRLPPSEEGKNRSVKTSHWVSPGIQGPEFGVPKVQRVKNEDHLWKSLVDNPGDWWDNRLCKVNERSPDFRHKVSLKPLWLHNSPVWVLPRLLPLTDPLRDEKPESVPALKFL